MIKPAGFKDALNTRFVLIALIALGMQIPLGLVHQLVKERHVLHLSVVEDVGNSWGGPQTLHAAVLAVPVMSANRARLGSWALERMPGATAEGHPNAPVVLLPAEVHQEVQLEVQTRTRGLYKALIYEAKVRVTGEFRPAQLTTLLREGDKLLWEQAELVLGLSNTRTITRLGDLKWGEQRQPVVFATGGAGGGGAGLFASSFRYSAPLEPSMETVPFSLDMQFRGSGYFGFQPLAPNTTVAVHSDWPHPSFQGAVLPVNHEISEDGFKASWSFPTLDRQLAQQFFWEGTKLDSSALHGGIGLVEPISLYAATERAVKYGILFVLLTYLSLLILELLTQARLHLVQYMLVGAALSLFYLVLLALAEHVGFAMSYLLASAITILCIGCYTAAALRDRPKGLLLALLLSVLYKLLYGVLQLEDYALLFGTLILICTIAGLMYLTKDLGEISPTSATPHQADPLAPD